MRNTHCDLKIDHTDLLCQLGPLNEQQLDELPFGVIGFTGDGLVKFYNRFESELTGLTREYVLGKHVFTQIAQCMNNFMVAQRFEDAWTTKKSLDSTLDYVLTWRMKPTSVKLRMMWKEQTDVAYLVLSPRLAMV